MNRSVFRCQVGDFIVEGVHLSTLKQTWERRHPCLLRLASSASMSRQGCLRSQESYGGHSALLRGAFGPNRNWYSTEVMYEHTSACCRRVSPTAALLIC